MQGRGFEPRRGSLRLSPTTLKLNWFHLPVYACSAFNHWFCGRLTWLVIDLVPSLQKYRPRANIKKKFHHMLRIEPGTAGSSGTSALCWLIYVTLTKDALETSIFLSRVPVLKHQTIRLGVPVWRPVLELKLNWQFCLKVFLNWHFNPISLLDCSQRDIFFNLSMRWI